MSDRPVARHSTILEKAQAAVDGPRQSDYGHPYDNHSLTGKLVSLWSKRVVWPDDLDEAQRLGIQVCVFNILQKVSRLANTPTHLDSLVDIAGYSRNWEMILNYPTDTTTNEDSDDPA